MLKERTLFEAAIVLIATLFFSLFITVLGSVSLKFQIAFAIGLFGLLAICLIPSRRTVCLCLWIIIQPLSIEKILYIHTPIWDNVQSENTLMNAADILLILLFCILIFEQFVVKKVAFVWDKKTTLFSALLLWGVFSYLIHLGIYQSDFTNVAPLGLVHMARNVFFVVVIGSAIQTRADVIWVLVAITFILFVESILVGLSFATGEPFNFTRLLGKGAFIQKYSAGGESVTRASATLGLPNQQATFHSMFTFLLVGLFAVKNKLFKIIGLVVMMMSFIAVIFTFSRSAWLSFAAATLLITIIFIKRKEVTPTAWLTGSFVAVVLIAILAVIAQPIIDRLSGGDEGATGSRVRMIMLAKDLAMQYPIIGVGPNEYAEAGLYLYPPGEKETEWVGLGDKAIVPPLGRVELATQIVPGKKPNLFTLPVHNKFMLTLSELGAVGLLIWLVIYYQFFKDAKLCSRSKDALFRFLGVAGIATSLIALIYMNLDLFSNEKAMQSLLFPMVFVSAVYRISKKQAH
jgi:hypothetical protein